jgi:hypothetical protein
LIDTQVKGEEIVFHYQAEHSPVAIRLVPEAHSKLPPGLILSLEISTGDGDHFLFQRSLELIHQVSLYYSSQDHCEIPCTYVFAKAESGHSLVKEICHKGTSSHFIKVLTLLKELEAKGIC